MLGMVTHYLKRHKYKIAVGVPVVVLLASSLSLVRSQNDLYIVPEDSRYVEVGELVTLEVTMTAGQPINVIGGSIEVPGDLLQIEQISTATSAIDLWTEKPHITESGLVAFSGGILTPGGFTGSGIVFELVVRVLAPGKATVALRDVQMLAHDGRGTKIASGVNPIVLSIRSSERPSPDVNGDKEVDFFDFGIVSARMFRRYEKNYDLNADGHINAEDLAIVFSNLIDESRLGSLAIRW